MVIGFIPIVLIAILAVVGLVWLLRPGQNDENAWVKVWEAANDAEVSVIKSLLEAENIPYAVVGEKSQNLLGSGTLGTGYNAITGPVRFEVPAPYQEAALALLNDLPQVQD